MSSSKGVGKPSYSLGKQKATAETTTPAIDEINLGVGDMGLNSDQNDGWEVYNSKSKNKGRSNSGKQFTQNPSPKAWGQPNTVQKLGMHNNVGSGRGSGNNWATPNDPRKPVGRANSRPQSYDRGFGNSYNPTPAAVPPALKNGWNWSATAASAHPKEDQDTSQDTEDVNVSEHDSEDNESDLPDDSEDELLSDDDDSDVADHETCKRKPQFKELFDCLDKLTVAEINEPDRQWHCAACKGGPGAIDWFKGLQAVITHAKTKSTKAKLHRELAQLLAEELRLRGTSAVPQGEVFRRWDPIEHKDKQVVWPPMVIIMNTRFDKDDDDKWIGMGNQELLDYCSSYAAVKAQHSYGPQGHRGMSVVIFEASPVGYFEAERLSYYFTKEGRDRDAWERLKYPVPYKLYGYMAEKRDIDSFNKHSVGKASKLKFEMRSYIETVSVRVKQMWEDNQQLTWFKNKATKYQRQAKALEESYILLSEKFRQTLEENKIVKHKTKMHHEQMKEENEYQDQFFKDHLKLVLDDAEDKDEKKQQELDEMVEQANANTSLVEDYRHRAEKIAKSIKLEDKKEFMEESEDLIRRHEERVAAMRSGHWEEEIAVEKKFDLELDELKKKYSPLQSEQTNGGDASGKAHFPTQSGTSPGESTQSGGKKRAGKTKK